LAGGFDDGYGGIDDGCGYECDCSCNERYGCGWIGCFGAGAGWIGGYAGGECGGFG
jgi:hypothetical protein